MDLGTVKSKLYKPARMFRAYTEPQQVYDDVEQVRDHSPKTFHDIVIH